MHAKIVTTKKLTITNLLKQTIRRTKQSSSLPPALVRTMINAESEKMLNDVLFWHDYKYLMTSMAHLIPKHDMPLRCYLLSRAMDAVLYNRDTSPDLPLVFVSGEHIFVAFESIEAVCQGDMKEKMGLIQSMSRLCDWIIDGQVRNTARTSYPVFASPPTEIWPRRIDILHDIIMVESVMASPQARHKWLSEIIGRSIANQLTSADKHIGLQMDTIGINTGVRLVAHSKSDAFDNLEKWVYHGVCHDEIGNIFSYTARKNINIHLDVYTFETLPIEFGVAVRTNVRATERNHIKQPDHMVPESPTTITTTTTTTTMTNTTTTTTTATPATVDTTIMFSVSSSINSTSAVYIKAPRFLAKLLADIIVVKNPTIDYGFDNFAQIIREVIDIIWSDDVIDVLVFRRALRSVLIDLFKTTHAMALELRHPEYTATQLDDLCYRKIIYILIECFAAHASAISAMFDKSNTTSTSTPTPIPQQAAATSQQSGDSWFELVEKIRHSVDNGGVLSDITDIGAQTLYYIYDLGLAIYDVCVQHTDRSTLPPLDDIVNDYLRLHGVTVLTPIKYHLFPRPVRCNRCGAPTKEYTLPITFLNESAIYGQGACVTTAGHADV